MYKWFVQKESGTKIPIYKFGETVPGQKCSKNLFVRWEKNYLDTSFYKKKLDLS